MKKTILLASSILLAIGMLASCGGAEKKAEAQKALEDFEKELNEAFDKAREDMNNMNWDDEEDDLEFSADEE